MAGTTRWVVLDGSSTAFEFNGTWTEETANSVHQSTLQTTTLDGSEMTFKFNGSEMILFGKTKAGGGGARPTVNCSVDGVPTNPDPRATGEDFACWWPTSDDDGTHTFLLNTTVPGSGDLSPSVSIDSLWFHPSFDSSISDEEMLVMYDNYDPHIQFSSGDWEILQDPDDNGVASTTNRTGATLSVVFIGTRIVWEGWRAAGSGMGRSSGTFYMDNSPPVSFNIDPSSSQATTKGITFIEVGGLSAGAHNLTVVYNGPSAPLILDHFLVKGGNFRIEDPLEGVVPSSSQDSVSPTSSSAPLGSSPSRNAPVGAIVGGVVGGFVAVALVIFAILCARKRSRKRKISERMSTGQTGSNVATPFTYPSPHQGLDTPGLASATDTSPSIRTSTNATSLTHHSAPNQSPNVYRKGQELLSAQPEGMGEIHRYEDSGVRLHQTGLPPVYTPD